MPERLVRGVLCVSLVAAGLKVLHEPDDVRLHRLRPPVRARPRGAVPRPAAAPPGGELPDDDFRPLRLQNGWYVQRHAPMLRVAVPYGELSSRQLRQLARIAREYDMQDAGPADRGFGHFTTRQNLQFNWIPLTQAPT
jgi:sulfite reductase beta subunit-like hemoprotein